MIRSEQITKITTEMIKRMTPNAVLQYAASHRDLTKEQVFAVYDDDKLLMVLGVKKSGAMMPAEIWVLLGKAFGLRYAKQAKQVVNSLIRRYNGLFTAINIEQAPDCRFAEFFGFRPRGPIINHAGDCYQIYEVYP